MVFRKFLQMLMRQENEFETNTEKRPESCRKTLKKDSKTLKSDIILWLCTTIYQFLGNTRRIRHDDNMRTLLYIKDNTNNNGQLFRDDSVARVVRVVFNKITTTMTTKDNFFVLSRLSALFVLSSIK